MAGVVLDASAVLALIRAEPGSDRVEELIGQGIISAVNLQEVIKELLVSGLALEGIETSLPYQKGTKVIATDEQGDPIYEDIGPTPRFLALSRKHLERLLAEQSTQP